MSEHTPTPWRLEEGRRIFALDLVSVAYCGTGAAFIRDGGYSISQDEADANAAFIVHCVNSHAALVAEVKAWRRTAEADDAMRSNRCPEDAEDLHEDWKRCYAAYAAAKEATNAIPALREELEKP